MRRLNSCSDLTYGRDGRLTRYVLPAEFLTRHQLVPRWTSTLYSTNPVPHSPLARQISCPCLRVARHRERSKCGVTMRRKRTSRKVLQDVFAKWQASKSLCTDATALDVWVLNQLRTLFHNATTDTTLDHRLRGEQTVFFLHLLGLDTTGHSYRPHSKVWSTAII